jgi:hypothetical protein
LDGGHLCASPETMVHGGGLGIWILQIVTKALLAKCMALEIVNMHWTNYS